MDIKDFVNTLTTETLNISEQTKRVAAWKSWYDGFVRSFHEHTIYNGTANVVERMKTLHMAKKVCEDWAELLFNERCLISTDDDKATTSLTEALDKLNFENQINHGVELGMALGTVGYVLTLSPKKELSLEHVTADKIYPLTTLNGRCTECAFVSFKQRKGEDVAYISIHQLNNEGRYIIENAIYEYPNKQVGKQIDHWVWETNMETPWFALFKPNAVNNFDLNSPYGISVFANCESVLKSIDQNFDAIDNETELGRMKLVASTEALEYYDAKGKEKPIFDPHSTLIMRMPKGINDAPIIENIAPQLRTQSMIDVLNNSLKLLSAKVGMGNNTYSFDSATGGIKTATEVISNNSPLYRRLVKHEHVLEDALRSLINSIASINTIYLNNPIHYDELFIHFDDSIIQDKDAERKQDERDMNSGVLSKVEYRMKWYGEDEETATKAVEQAQKFSGYNSEDNF